ncbi:MAG TPA: nitrilase-related carbon-nitrogen hydrolase, partial [Pirellulales bacterium]|nr:nitrilase-related carbon-nitrogen hydrolase [Pirellulales bacterium]
AAAFGPTGALVARYAKLQPFTLADETKHYEAGGSVVTFPWQGFSVAPFVCYDLRFPELFRASVRRGAELMVVIANWPQSREAHWLALLRARAIENQSYVLGVNRAGDDPHLRYGGHSLLVDPRGETVIEAGSGPQVLSAEIERATLVDYRRDFPALGDMRSDIN